MFAIVNSNGQRILFIKDGSSINARYEEGTVVICIDTKLLEIGRYSAKLGFRVFSDIIVSIEKGAKIFRMPKSDIEKN